MAYLRDRRAFGNIGTRKFRGARFGDALSPRGPQYTLEGRVLDYSTGVGPFTIVDQSGESNTATLYSGRGLTMDAVNDTVTYDTGYSSASRTATVWMRVTALGARTLNGATGTFTFTPTATNTWEELSSTATVSGDLAWTAGSDCDIGDLTCATEHWTHNDWSDPTGDTSNGKTIVDSGPNDYHGTCTGCSGFTGEGIDPEVAGIVGLDDARWFNGVDSEVSFGDTQDEDGSTAFFVEATILPASVLLSSIVDKQAAAFNYQGYAFRVIGGELQFTIGSSGANRITVVTAGANLNDGAVHVCRATYDGSKNGSGVSFLVDGVSQSVSIGTDAFTGNSAATGINLAIGDRDADGAVPFKGTIYAVNINDQLAVTGLGTSVTAWEDTIGSNDGTESGTFVTVGQKRATIPQTADKNWNKYQWFNGTDTNVGLGAGDPLGFNGSAKIEWRGYIYVTGTAPLSASKNAFATFVNGGSAGFSVALNAANTLRVAGRSVSTDGFQNYAVAISNGLHYVKCYADFTNDEFGISIDEAAYTTQSATFANNTYTFGSSTNPTQIGAADSANGWDSILSTISILKDDVASSAYTGLGNDPWKDTIGTNDGTESGTFTRELVAASDANDQIDALGTAISEPRLNTQQINLFGEGEYSSTPDSASLDLTTTATWELWGNFYGVPASTQQILTKQGDAGAGKRSWIIQKLNTGAADEARFLQFSAGDVATIVTFSGIPDSVGMLSFTLDQSSGILAYFNGVPLTVSAHTPAIIGASDAPVVIGSNAALLNVYDDKIGSTKLYNVALTADEVLTNYNTQKSLYGL
jgi:hypothetical protein